MGKLLDAGAEDGPRSCFVTKSFSSMEFTEIEEMSGRVKCKDLTFAKFYNLTNRTLRFSVTELA